MKRKSFLLLFFLGLILLFSSIFLPYFLSDKIHHSKVKQLEEVLHSKEETANETLQGLQNTKFQDEDAFEKLSENLEDKYFSDGLAFYIFHNRQLIYWSDDAIAFQTDSIFYEKNIQKLGNGWYKIIKVQSGQYTFVALIQIYKIFKHENQFLHSAFHKDYQLSDNYLFTANKRGFQVKDEQGNFLFSVLLHNQRELPPSSYYFFSILFILGISIFILLISKIPSLVGRSLTAILFLIIVRLLMAIFRIPQSMYKLDAFGPDWYEGSYWIPSFGDLFLHGILLLVICYFIQQLIIFSKSKKIFVVLFYTTLVFLISDIIIFLMTELIRDSKMSFDLNNLFQLNTYSYLGLMLMAVLFAAFFLLADALLRKMMGNMKVKSCLSILLGFFIINSILLESFGLLNWVYKIWLIFLFALILIKARKSRYYSLPSSLMLLLIISLVAAYVIQNETQKKELATRTYTITKFAEEEDPIAEYLFTEIQKKLLLDTVAHGILANYWNNEEKAKEFLKSKYFNAYWEKFEIFFTPCFVGDSLMIASNNTEVDCINFFRQRLKNEGKSVSANNLFQLNNTSGRISYLSEVPIEYKGELLYLFIEMYTRPFNDNEGYPELLLDENEINKSINLEEYSIAIYNKKKLINSSGDYNYTLNWNTSLPPIKKPEILRRNNYEHLLYLNQDETLFVLSKKRNTLFNFLTSLSYLLAIFAITFVLLSFIIPGFPIKIRFSSFDFTARLQFFIIGSLFTTLMLFGISTSYYIQKQYQQKNYRNIQEKMRSVLLEIEQKFPSKELLDSEMKEYLSFLLFRLSNIFYSDINIYRPDGLLYASSRPEVFDIELKARRMDPKAVRAMILKQKKEYIQEESIGRMDYLSAYEPLRNHENELVAYLNLPYFAKQNELEKEISAFLVSTINLYVIIFALVIMISVFIVNQLSKPLRLIREKIRKLRLGASNELIEWESEDEIGSLVKEYNRMVVELGESVETLAKSERESAWREMAKQVAHEIKNPLTPMKLSIQHLKRAYDDESEDLDARIERTTQTLIEQIDTLAGIANEFASFAQMPETNKVKTDLLKSVKIAANLYREKDKMDLDIITEVDPAYVYADKDQLLRVFNNLIKNAVQSVPVERHPIILIHIESERDHWKVSIEDNGSGIPKDQMEKIFIPNFTTKTGGMGLGLAMVKTIIDNLQGEIWFDTEEGKGSTFYLRIPKWKMI